MSLSSDTGNAVSLIYWGWVGVGFWFGILGDCGFWCYFFNNCNHSYRPGHNCAERFAIMISNSRFWALEAGGAERPGCLCPAEQVRGLSWLSEVCVLLEWPILSIWGVGKVANKCIKYFYCS